jgi:hypothetical protein
LPSEALFLPWARSVYTTANPLSSAASATASERLVIERLPK